LNSKIQIKKAMPEHLVQVVEIYNQAIVDGNSTADLETYQPSEKKGWFDAHHEKVVAWLSLTPYRPGRKAFAKVREVSLYVHRDHRSKGIAPFLLSHAIADARSLGLEYFIGILLGVNKHSIRFVEGNGFVLWASLPSIADLNGTKSDHLYYGLKLDS
jgi:L-amino acid N-acyltransferase YncA